jgi:hypothetical protein
VLGRNRRIGSGKTNESRPSVVVYLFNVERECLLRPGLGGCPIKNLMNINRITNPVLLAVVAHVLSGDSRWGGRPMPEVDPIDRLIDFPFDIAGIHPLGDHPPTLRTVWQPRSITVRRRGRGRRMGDGNASGRALTRVNERQSPLSANLRGAAP